MTSIWRRGGLALLLVLLAAGVASPAGNCTVYKTWLSNEVLTAADLNNSFVQAATTNSTAPCVDDYSATTTQMQTTTNPYPGGAESLATSLAGELERLRHQLGRLTVGTSLGTSGFWWYVTPQEGNRPSLARNGSVEKWSAGTAVAPDDWTLNGAGATVARNSTAGQFKHGSYSADLTRAGTDAYLATAAPAGLTGGSAYFQGRTYTAGAWVRATVASRARIGIWDGVAVTYSSYHTGGSAFEYLTVTKVLSGSASTLDVRLQVDTGNTTAQFDGVMLAEGYLAPSTTVSEQDQAVTARVHNSLSISVPNNSATALTFDSERFDSHDIHSTSVNTSRLTVPFDGLYLVSCHVQWAGNATGIRQISLRVSGATDIAYQTGPQLGAGTTVEQSVATLYRLTATQYVECRAFQNSGGSLNANSQSAYSPEFVILRVAP